jgi:DNA-nicking Smr family endonuclease
MGKGGGHDKDDAALWARVVETAAPLRKPRSNPPKPVAATPVPPGRQAKPVHSAPIPKPAPRLARVAQEERLDRQTSRQLEKGRLAVEARLDLHGMLQRDAHAALRRFLKAAQADGLRHVLVITGKGTEPGTAKSFYEEEARGVLRQAVPGWLVGPEFSNVVLSFSAAPRRLGGEGALYVRLRRPDRS